MPWTLRWRGQQSRHRPRGELDQVVGRMLDRLGVSTCLGEGVQGMLCRGLCPRGFQLSYLGGGGAHWIWMVFWASIGKTEERLLQSLGSLWDSSDGQKFLSGQMECKTVYCVDGVRLTSPEETIEWWNDYFNYYVPTLTYGHELWAMIERMR